MSYVSYFILVTVLILWCRATFIKREELKATKEIKKRRLSSLDPESIMSPDYKGGEMFFDLFPLESLAHAGNKQDEFLKGISKRNYGELIELYYQIKELDRKIGNENMAFWLLLIFIIGIVILFFAG